MRWTCVACDRETHASRRPPTCGCGVAGTWCLDDPIVLGAVPAPALAADVEHVERPRISLGDLDHVLGDGVPAGSTIVIYGRAGTGKSRLVLREASRMNRTLVVALEQGVEGAAATASAAGARLERLWIQPTLAAWREAADSVSARVLVVDSAGEVPLGDLRRLLDQIGEWARDRRACAIVITHANKRSEVYGSTYLEHWPDAVLRVMRPDDGLVEIRQSKCRWAPPALGRFELEAPAHLDDKVQ